MNIVLRRWEERLGKYEFSCYSGGVLCKPVWNEKSKILGVYAKYREGSFCYWVIDETHFVAWNEKVVEIMPSDKICWFSGVFGRELSIQRKEKEVLKFQYHTLLKYPLDIFDDDWGLVFDLPSFFDSCANQQDLKNSLKEYLNAFNK